jgi:hypothetical protein
MQQQDDKEKEGAQEPEPEWKKQFVVESSEAGPSFMSGSFALMNTATGRPVFKAKPIRPCACCMKAETRPAEFPRCSGCRTTYCSSTCQSRHWKIHKADCAKWAKELQSYSDCQQCAPIRYKTGFRPCPMCLFRREIDRRSSSSSSASSSSSSSGSQ